MIIRSRFDEAVLAFERIHRQDPRTIFVEGKPLPWSVFYHQRLGFWITQLTDTPSEALRLASHSQHLKRWAIPRTRFPEGRAGYRQWRKRLARFHALKASRILRRAGYPEEVIARVGELLEKRRLRVDPEVQLFEDAICLVFLENELIDFAGRKSASKVASILEKTWRKMSQNGRRHALELSAQMPPMAKSILKKALAAEPGMI